MEQAKAVAHEKYDRLIAAARNEATIKVAVAHPCDDVSLRGAVEAMKLGLIEPILVGPIERLRSVAAKAGIDIEAMEIVASQHSHDSATKAVELVVAGRADVLDLGRTQAALPRPPVQRLHRLGDLCRARRHLLDERRFAPLPPEVDERDGEPAQPVQDADRGNGPLPLEQALRHLLHTTLNAGHDQ